MNIINPTQKKKKSFRCRERFLGVILVAALIAAPGFSFAKDKDDEVTRMEFIQLMAKNQSQSKLLPANASSLSSEKLYEQVARNLKKSGSNVLAGKNPDKPLSQQEFVRLTYAFADQPAGKSLFEQKQYLKEAEIISSADVGLTTGLQGRAVQYRGEEDAYSPSEIAAPVFMQDRVETDLDSMVTFTFDDGSSMSLGEDAVVNITEHIYDPERDFRKTIVNVALGAVRFKVTKGKAEGSMFQVITPVATAGVRGTEFVTIVNPGGKTRFVGLEGKVETFARLANGKEGKHEFVVAGTLHDISDKGASLGLQKADAATMDKAFNKTNPNKKMKNLPNVTMAKAMVAVQGDLKLGKALGKSKGKAKGKAKGHAKVQTKGKKGKSGKKKIAGKGNKGNKSASMKAAKGAAKNAAKGAAKDAAKKAVKGAAKDSAKSAAKKAAKSAALQTAKKSIKESTKQVVQVTAGLTGGNPNPVGNPNFVPPGHGGTPPGQGGGGPPGGGPPGGGPPGGGPPGGGPPGGGPPGGGPPCGIPPCGGPPGP